MTYTGILDKLFTLAALPEGWDSYGGLPMDWRAGNLAAEIARKLIQYGHPTPHLVPCSNGGVQLEWASGGTQYEIRIPPTGMVEMLACCNDDILSEWTVDRASAIDHALRLAGTAAVAAECYGQGEWPAVDSLECSDEEC